MPPTPYDPTKRLPPERSLLGYRQTDDHIADREHQAAWAAHVAAGRIGTRPPVDPVVWIKRERMERALRGIAC